MKKLAIITTHPIQYNAPFFKMLAERKNIAVMVFYTWSQSEKQEKYDPGFKQNVEWDIPLLEGYPYCFVNNTSSNQGSHHFKGIINPTLIQEIKDWNANAVLVYGWSFKSHLQVLQYFKNIVPVLFRGDSTLLDEQQGIKKLLRKIWLKYIYRKIDYAMYVGNANKKYFLAHGVNENQLIFMPHAIDNNRFSCSEKIIQKSKAIKASLGIADDGLVFLFVGKLEQKKQPLLLLDAFKQLNSNAHLIFVGSGALEEYLKTNAANNLNVHFLGFRNQGDMPIMYALCDVFVLPSSGPGETWGLSINEAMASGKAVLASDACGAVYDLLFENGFIFKKKNATDFLEKLKSFNTENVITYGNRSSKNISNYTFLNQCLAIENLLIKAENEN